jgi:hypothetical protein
MTTMGFAEAFFVLCIPTGLAAGLYSAERVSEIGAIAVWLVLSGLLLGAFGASEPTGRSSPHDAPVHVFFFYLEEGADALGLALGAAVGASVGIFAGKYARQRSA